ncbi:MAG: serine hydrolase [Saprospiraceae bacterium]|nr:serine hydrolase [Lewinellaceae bacterium]
MHCTLRLLSFLLLLVPRTICTQPNFYFPPTTGTAWETTDPTSLGFCPERIDSLYQFLDDHHTKSFILLQDGKIVLERYFGTFTQDSFWYWASAGKSLTAFLVGQAQEAGLLHLDDPTSDYLGAGWTSATPAQEAQITIRHQLSMTTGLDDTGLNDNCLLPGCLTYLADPGTRWAYYNAPYRLLHDVLEAASGQSINQFTNTRLFNAVGMKGLWIDHVMYGKARDMARFGLLTLAKGIWDGDTLLHDQQYQFDMVHSSQNLNKSYGYLWWLNGQENFMLPGLQIVFPGKVIPNAPDDMFAALGKDDQKIHVVPSKGWVVVRQGEAGFPGPGGGAVPIVFDNAMWDYLNKLTCSPTKVNAPDTAGISVRIWPNPTVDSWTISAPAQIEQVELCTLDGRLINVFQGQHSNTLQVNTTGLSAGRYLVRIFSGGKAVVQNAVLLGQY